MTNTLGKFIVKNRPPAQRRTISVEASTHAALAALADENETSIHNVVKALLSNFYGTSKWEAKYAEAG